MTPAVTVEAGTVAPVFVGAGARVELGPRLRLGVAGGAMPQLYVDGINGAIDLLYADYTEAEATLVDVALDRALALRLAAGARPFSRLGFTVDGTYTLVAAAGSTTGAEVVTAFVDARLAGGAPTLDARASLHLLGPEVGWEQAVWRGLTVRGGVGFLFTVASSASIAADTRFGTFDGALATEGEQALVDLFEGYGHTPTLSLTVGWTFGG